MPLSDRTTPHTRPILHPPGLRDGARWAGKRIGLFGGTFDPPHAGHLYIARAALNWLKLDAVWWLVSPGHPLKTQGASENYARRLERCRALVNHPRILVSALEQEMGTYGTFNLVQALQTRFARTDFVFVGGMDLHLQFHRWHDWDRLLQALPVAFFARPPFDQMVRGSHVRGLSPLAMPQTALRRPLSAQMKLNAPHIYWIQSSHLLDISSTHLRRCRIASDAGSAVE